MKAEAKSFTIPTDAAPVGAGVPVGPGVTDASFKASMEAFLRSFEPGGEEIVGVGLFAPAPQAGGAPSTPVNIMETLVGASAVGKPELEVFVIASDDELREKLRTYTPIERGYAVMRVGDAEKRVLVARKGRSLVWRGKISTFGGPGDTGMKPTEPLAIIRDADIAANPKIAALFEGGTGPALGRRLLNKTTSYIACRWDYKTTPRKHLLGIEVEVRNPATGKSIKARPADWGPAEWTNRVADLSDFAAGELGLKTDDICEVIVPLPAGVAGPVLPTAPNGPVRAALVAVARDQYQRYHGKHEAHEPMSSRVKGYWDDLKAEAGNEFTFTSVTGVPWSAVFVCWCLQKAGVSHAAFRFSRQHSVYIHAAIGRANAAPAKTFPGLDALAYAPEPGDIIHWNRGNGKITYAEAKTNSDYLSHSAIVVSVGEDDQGPCVITVGGNESESVGDNRLPLDPATGRLVPRKEDPYIAIIKMA